ncbi:hypothetical protein IEQ34_004516 [Dendrobium chrysotoxum]|uniref:Uncharacterized protein n=1 Tax=Dendrobium chrysotoxum TaxID=161865 RepID=A0AAV7HGY0_DENCH|nr:hypothetical protein IEQ34_004516 [Dendrobium chrysotoxum]
MFGISKYSAEQFLPVRQKAPTVAAGGSRLSTAGANFAVVDSVSGDDIHLFRSLAFSLPALLLLLRLRRD